MSKDKEKDRMCGNDNYGFTGMPYGMMPQGNMMGYMNPMQMNPMMNFPNNGMNNFQNDFETRLNRIERQINRINGRLNRLENPYAGNNNNLYNEPDNNVYMM